MPILPEEQEDRRNYILNDCKPVCVLVHKDYYKLIGNNKYINLDNENYLNNENIKSQNKENDIAYMIYTSGTTGNPKGVKVMHKNICSLKYSLENDKILKPTSKDISLSLLKYSFDASGIDIYSALLFGGKLVLVKKENELNPNLVVRLMGKEKITRSFLIPKWLEHIALEDKRQNANLSSVKILGSGGESLKPELIKTLYEKYSNLKIVNLYGPTETTMFTTYKIIGKKELEDNYTTIGKPIYANRALILNKSEEIMPIGISGELCIYEDEFSSQNIADGYLNKIEETNKKFKKIYDPLIDKDIRIYKTGDIARLNNDLELEFCGREDDIVKVNGGYLISLNEVQKRIKDILKYNYDVEVLAIPNNNTKVLVAFIKQKKQHSNIDDINKFINNKLTFYMRPKKIIKIEDFPSNNSGKIDRKKLKEEAIELLKAKANIILPSTQTEQIIYNVTKKYVTTQELSITDDFMQDLSIDSLAIASIYTELESLGIEMQDIYTYTNIKELAQFIDNSKKQDSNFKVDDVNIVNDSKRFDLRNILLTGVTGFLGIHLLYELLSKECVEKVYCIIREKDFKNAQERFKEKINYYFNKDLQDCINKKVVIIEGNVTKQKFGLEEKEYLSLQKSITTVVNSAANVRHYGKEESIIDTNVQSVKNILEFCKNNISLAHMSTLSIGGFKTKESENFVFTEDSFNIKQTLNNNPYLISKLKSEELILNDNVNSKIFRLGNIMPRQTDGIFQNNYEQNAFVNAIKVILDMQKIPQEFLNEEIELSPVDECAKSIAKLLESDSDNKVYHIVNDKLIKVEELVNILQDNNYNIEVVNIETFIEELNNCRGIGRQYIKEYALKNKVNNYSIKKTIYQLEKMNFKWKEIDAKYIKNIVKIIEKNRW